jgi:adenine/guanine phosphoribosyltransferase-like PRPP-binding protein
LFRCLDIKSRSAVSQVKAYDLAERTAVSDRATAFSKKVVALFDDFIAKGNTVLDSTKLTNRALKAESHPWATYEVVAMVLRKAGKFRKKRG